MLSSLLPHRKILMKFYNDPTAEMTYLRLRAELEPFCRRNFPHYNLVAAGFREDVSPDEIVIKLHLTRGEWQGSNPEGSRTAVASETPCGQLSKPPQGLIARFFRKS